MKPERSHNPRCPFCDILDGSDPDARVVYRGRDVVAFFPTEPAVLGHLLVVPTRHFARIWDCDPQSAAALGEAVARLSFAVVNAMGAEGLNVIQSNGDVATQTVDHVHVHLVPRRRGDNIGRIWPPETTYSESAKDRAWDAVRDACATLD